MNFRSLSNPSSLSPSSLAPGGVFHARPALWPCRELGLHPYGSLQADHPPLLLLRSSRHLFLSFTRYLQQLWHLTWAMCPDLVHDAHLPGEASPEPAPTLLMSLPGVNLSSKKHPFRGPYHHLLSVSIRLAPQWLPFPTITTTHSPLLRPPAIPPVPSPPHPLPSHTIFMPSDFLPLGLEPFGWCQPFGRSPCQRP